MMDIKNRSSQTLVNIAYTRNDMADLLHKAQDSRDYEEKQMRCDACLALATYDYDFTIDQETALINEFINTCE